MRQIDASRHSYDGEKDIKGFLADREFVGRDRFTFLEAERIPFHISSSSGCLV